MGGFIMILFTVLVILCIIKNTDGGDICLNDYWYELCNKAKEDIILSTDTFLPITCCCLSSQTKSALFYYPSLEPNGNPKVEQYHYDQQWLFKVIAKHNNFTTDGLVIACWGDGDKCNINKEKRQLLIQKKVAVLLHNFEKTENDILSSLYSNNNFIFIPDHLFLRSNGYKDLISSMNNFPNNRSLIEREPKVFWRGSSTGKIFSQLDNDRYKMCIIAKNCTWVDAGITQAFSQYSKQVYSDNGILKSFANEYEWIKYRGIIDIDGSVNAWGLYWRLASGSVLFKVESNWTNAIIEKMIPWKHYISLKEDLSDFEAFTSLITNEKFIPVFEKITKNALDLVKEFTFDKEVDRVVASLNEFWKT